MMKTLTVRSEPGLDGVAGLPILTIYGPQGDIVYRGSDWAVGVKIYAKHTGRALSEAERHQLWTGAKAGGICTL